MGAFYVVFAGSYPTGQKYVLHVPTYPYNDSDTNYFYDKTVNQATYLFPWFDHTYFQSWSSESRQARLVEHGFTSVAETAGAAPKNVPLYLDETHYLTVIDGNHYQYTTPNGVYEQNPTGSDYESCTPVGPGGCFMSVSFNRVSGENVRCGYWQLAGAEAWAGDFWAHANTFDSYEQGGISEAGGGDGTFDFSSTDIPIPGLPQIGAMSTGFLNLYNPSPAQLRALASYMWSGSFDINNFRKIVADPMDAILGLHIIPTVAGHPASTSASLYVGNIDTGLSMLQLTEQYYEVDCQTVQIPAKWGAYLDYAPYTTLSLYLPYIGIVPISADDCMRGSITVKYHIDALSGTCTAFVYCYSNRGADGHTLYTFTGSCACECPVTEGQYANAVIAGFKAVGGIIGMAAGAAAGSAGMVMGGIGDAANAALSAIKPEIGRSGNMGGSAGLMGIQYPYLILTVPRMCTPGEQNVMRGYPSYITRTMSQLSGFNAIDVTHMEGMTCTDDEIAEIVQQLSEGVIF